MGCVMRVAVYVKSVTECFHVPGEASCQKQILLLMVAVTLHCKSFFCRDFLVTFCQMRGCIECIIH